MTFPARKNPTDAEIIAIVRASANGAARRVVDPRTGDVWVWAAELATHAEGAALLGIPCDRPPGEGDILVL